MSSLTRTSFVASLLPVTVLAFTAAPQDSTRDSTLVSRNGFLPLPIFFYTPETGIAGGGSVLYFYRNPDDGPHTRPSNLASDVIYTEEHQLIAEVGYELYFQHEQYRIGGSFEFVKYPDKFFGIGNQTPDSLEERFTARSIRIRINALTAISKEFNAGLTYYFENRKMVEVDPTHALATGLVPGSTGGITSGAGVLCTWDTRDNIFSAYHGRFYQASLMFSHPTIGSDYKFGRFNIDLREFKQLGESQILAFQAFGIFTSGTAPFHKLATLGGQNLMRGYFEGRYRDNDYLAVQTEFRTTIFWRIGGVAFLGAGDVAHTLSGFKLAEVKPSYGLGVRFSFSPEERLNIRMDFGFGKGSSGVYVGASEVF